MSTPHHRVSLEWMGEAIVTLDDLIPENPRAICVGINPAPVSVAAGHYYQGRQGQRFFARLRQAGVLTAPPSGGFDDDTAIEEGIGFTDIVRRRTPSADGVRRDELQHGASLLVEKLRAVAPPVLIFPFKAAAVALVGGFAGNGWLRGRELAGARLFVMPGPYENRTTATRTIATLRDGLSA